MLRAMPRLVSDNSTALLGNRIFVSLIVDVNSVYSSQAQLRANVFVNDDPSAVTIKLVTNASNQSVYTGKSAGSLAEAVG